jgi:hypothetical protein
MRRVSHLLLGATLLCARPAWSDPAPTIGLRSGEHLGFGRLVFDLPRGAAATAEAQDGGVLIRASGAALGVVPPLPRNVAGLHVTGSTATVTPAPGATWRVLRLGDRLVIDVLDPPTTRPPGEAASAAAAAPGRALFSGPPPRPHPRSAAPVPPPPPPAMPAVAAPAPRPAPQPPPEPVGEARTADPAVAAPSLEPAPLAAVSEAALPPVPSGPGPVAIAAGIVDGALVLPFAPGTGAAAFRRGQEAVVVFDEHRPLDLAAAQNNPVFGAAAVQVLPAATVLRLPLPVGQALRLARAPNGWAVRVLAADEAPDLAPIRPETAAGEVRMPAAHAGQIVSVPDPVTGADLLVGTETAAGEAVPVERRTPDYALLATFLGVALAPVSDADTLRAAPPGFVLQPGSGRSLALGAPDAEVQAVAEAARLTRRWDFPALPLAALSRRLQAALDAAANAPPQSRSALRLAAVQAQLALGLGAEAEALATLTETEDARAAQAPDAAGLAAVAALLAGRVDEADAIEDPRLSGSDEVALWRAVRVALRHEGAPEAAPAFAATLPLLLAYPEPLRARLLPLAAETLVGGGERAAARKLLEARKDDAALDYARALLEEAEGHAAPALAILDRLAQSPDRRARARAAVRAVELRLRIGGLSTAQAAEALDRLLYAWRGGEHELALRLRVAALDAESGKWRAALALLRESADGAVAEGWAAQRKDLHRRLQETFAAALDADARKPFPPFDLVSLVDENPDLLPQGDAGRALAVRLADRLAALDLPQRAAPLLRKLTDGTPPGAARAELGERLAALELGQGDPTAALTALSDSVATDLPAELNERRTITFARASAARGALGPAVATLAALDTPAADEARAALLETAKDWPAATAALLAYAAHAVPPDGALDEAQARILLRLATAAAHAGDEAVLTSLRTHALARMPAGKLADMLRLLTDGPVENLPDLPRAAQQAALAQELPAALRALDPVAGR